MKTFTIAAALVAASLAAVTAAPAHAQQPGSEPRIAVSYSDLNLATAAGRAALELRLLHAARTACGLPSPADAQGAIRLHACVQELRAAAAGQVRSAVQLAREQAPREVAAR
jgi:UrcA family protein